jgi:phosphate starvation-inducible PhoH-like protein
MAMPVAGSPGREVLQALYERLETGRAVEPGDIDGEIRLGADGRDRLAGDQMEMFKGGKVEIKTRKKLVEPRTEAQKAYVRNLFDNELAFGIGPPAPARPISPSPSA